MSLPEDEIAEVSIIGDQDSVFGNGNCQDILVRQARRMILTDTGGIVPSADEKRPDSRLGALIEQKPHRAVVAALDSAFPCRARSCCWTRSAAYRRHARTWSIVSSG